MFACVVKIPFSKLILANEGHAQNEYGTGFVTRIDYHSKVRSVGITLMDFLTGPFSLEIDYIAVLRNKNHKEITAYESFQVPVHYRY